MKILIIEDDPNIVDTLNCVLRLVWADIKVISTPQGRKGIELVETQSPDIILLDLGLPDLDGYDVLRQIRLFSSIPVIIITVRAEETALVKAFQLDANDYLIKPFRQMELIARIKACLKKRTLNGEDLTITCGDIHFGASINELFVRSKKIMLTSFEGRLFYHLIQKAGKVVTKNELAEILWGESVPETSDNIKNYICRLRKKIEYDSDLPKIILNHRGIGYTVTPPHSV
ncbi:response regulator transcription factor [Dehalogenimonas etheniformans]|uniref:DNA-binding response regulator n=1 Tax=Dehalogenimonas etheniformans TaxID=1536648 RepID=A0A2P5P5J6_9CHLR|nr:response regulator transcription factor [Dehalogenimonas etheniformans]PPD57563.1 DNA-binding response regulator [Dehalogenimonas etheniformans]QNT75902.1 response regulator transcription factor [Dehalogenimonas etheniformans]